MRLLLQVIFLIIFILGACKVYNYFENQKSMHDVMQAINMQVDACTIDMQKNKSVICD